MKLFGIAVIGLVLGVEALALKPVYFHQPLTAPRTAHAHQVKILPSQAVRVGLDLCPTCCQFTDQAINMLLNIILNAGIVGTCGDLCSLLEQKTGNKALGAVCDLLCDIVGIDEFIKLIQKADLDPIYLCELLTACPIFDNGDAKIVSLGVTPRSGPQGTEFTIQMTYVSRNGTGTGEIALGIETVDGLPLDKDGFISHRLYDKRDDYNFDIVNYPFLDRNIPEGPAYGDSFLSEQQPAGTYQENIRVKAAPDPNCDPTQQMCEQWLPGNYIVKLDVCNGECGSAHPHSKIYDSGSTNFTLTG